MKKQSHIKDSMGTSAPVDIPGPKRGHHVHSMSESQAAAEFHSNKISSNTEAKLISPQNSVTSAKMGSSTGSAVKSPLPIHKRLLHSLSIHSQITESGSAHGSRLNIVTDSCSFIPSLTSTFSLDVVEFPPCSPPLNKRLLQVKQLGSDLGEATQVSTSYQDKLEHVEEFDLDEPTYQDTITSTDSSASLLKRTFSLPSDYQYSKSKSQKIHANEIWKDYLPDSTNSSQNGDLHNIQVDIYNSDESIKSNRNIYQPHTEWRQTMDDLLEKPEYINSLEKDSSATAHLAQAAKSYVSQQSKLSRVKEEIVKQDEKSALKSPKRQKTRAKKNLFTLSISFTCTFTAYIALRNLMSSLYSSLGMYSLCMVYASLVISCIFSTLIVGKLRPKYTMVVCFIGFLIYSVCNFYPSYYTLLPAAAIAGFSLSNSWTAQATYLSNNAATYAMVTGQSLMNVLATFNGIFYLFFQSSQIIGGLISSFVLMIGEKDIVTHVPIINESFIAGIANTTEENKTAINYELCGANYCHGVLVHNPGVEVNPAAVYFLLGILTTFSIAGIIIVFFFLDPLEGEMSTAKQSATCLSQVTAVFKVFGDWRMLCLVPYALYTLIQMSFMFGEFTKAFVTCSTGVHMVGYVMLTVASCCALSSYMAGKLTQHTGRSLLVVFGCFVHITLLVVMRLWEPNDERFFVMFIIAGAWGMADGILNTQLISLIGVLFADNRAPAFACLKMLQALGAFTFFLTGTLLCTYVKIYILLGLLLSALLGYTTLEVGLKERKTWEKNKAKLGPTTV